MFIHVFLEAVLVREFLLVVIGLPTLLSLVWMGVFGNLAISQIIDKVGPLWAKQVNRYLCNTLFQVYEQLPLSGLS
ncbi:BCCT family transporter [Pseudoalteromonas sp. Hal099]